MESIKVHSVNKKNRNKPLILLFLFHLLFAPQHIYSCENYHYRDSLRQHILGTGFAEFDCHLSYPIGGSLVDSLFGNNASELTSLHRFLHCALVDTLVCVRQINITGYCSVDDTQKVNELLGKNRANRFYRFLDARYGIEREYPVEVKSVGTDWSGLRKLVAASPYSWKEDALRIIDTPGNPEWKKIQIASLGGGDAHRRMYEEFYPQLRRVMIKISYDVQCMKQKLNTVRKPEFGKTNVPILQLQTLNRQPSLNKAKKIHPVIAVKTNLLFDVALIPNIELEIPLGSHWSLNGEYMFPWWLVDNDKYCMQLLSGSLEGRWWLGNRIRRKPLTGHFAGIYTGGGKYDLQWKEKGYRGVYFITAGLSYGYSLSLSKRWNMEFSLGVGMMRTDYRLYKAEDDYRTLFWQKNGRYTWFGPTKAKISLVWLLGNKKGGKK